MPEHEVSVPITVVFPASQARELRELAAQEDRPLSSMVRRLVTAGIEATFEAEAE
jgi:hypothetical protein